ncbi:MAG TPA: TatD family hydrolase [Opitutaceae bacterium]
MFAALTRLPLGGAVVNGTCESDWPEVTALCTTSSTLLRASYGLHPWHVGNASPQWRETLLRTLDVQPRAALGEIGLDRWIIDRARPDDPRLAGLRRASLEEQREAFVWQLRLATERNLPVTIHCLEAWGALTEILRTHPLPARGFLLHAYGGSADIAQKLLPLGARFSFNGSFLHERHLAKREVFKGLPLDRLLVETDAPAMPLAPSQRAYALPDLSDGTAINHPANLVVAYEGLAAIRGMPRDALATAVAENFSRFFGA